MGTGRGCFLLTDYSFLVPSPEIIGNSPAISIDSTYSKITHGKFKFVINLIFLALFSRYGYAIYNRYYHLRTLFVALDAKTTTDRWMYIIIYNCCQIDLRGNVWNIVENSRYWGKVAVPLHFWMNSSATCFGNFRKIHKNEWIKYIKFLRNLANSKKLALTNFHTFYALPK